MFTGVVHKNLAAAEGYFSEHLSQNDYYAAGEIRAGQWIGLGADLLGLKEGREVNRQEFHHLCENQHPLTGEQLTSRQKKEGQRRVFFDFTCSAPKSVSILAVTLQDQRLTQAHEQSARIAFRELERFAATRVRKNGTARDRTTANLIAGSFLHTTSRALDPQLHTHFTVFNGTFDQKEKQWKALQAGPMYDAIRYATQVYRNELARRVLALGLRIRSVEHGFEVDGIAPEILRRFSKRSQARDEVVKELEARLGRKLSNNEVAYAVHRSRQRKLTGIATAEVLDRQRAQLSAAELDALQQLQKPGPPSQHPSHASSESEALAYAMAHVFERASVVAEHDLLAAALADRVGEIQLPRLKEAVGQSPQLVPAGRGLSTRQILETELFLIHEVNTGRDQVEPLQPRYVPAARLSEDQQNALRHVLGSSDRITGIRGWAGAGKSTVLQELAQVCTATGLELIFCAPTTAATDVLRKEGLNAVTLQSLLMRNRPLSRREVLVLDEAGLVGIDDMKRLFQLTRDSRVVLSGDSGQHGSVPRGDALRILEEHSELQLSQLGRIRRQRRADYRRAVELAAQKRVSEAFQQLERMGAIVELPVDTAHAAATQAYLEGMRDHRATLVVAPTWREIDLLSDNIRSALKREGRLDANEKAVSVFQSLSWTKAQKRSARELQPGMLLRFPSTRSKKEQTVQVVEVHPHLTVRHADGKVAPLNLHRLSSSFDVGQSKDLKVAAGEKLLLQANYQKRFRNGELVEVASIQGETITLADGRVIPKDYRTFTHGYAVTSHAAQGRTADEVLVVATARSGPAVHQEQFYVSISRGRDRCRVFTDDKELLRARLGVSSQRPAALEVVNTGLRSRLLRRVMQWSQRIGWLMNTLRSAEKTIANRHGYRTYTP